MHDWHHVQLQMSKIQALLQQAATEWVTGRSTASGQAGG